MLLLRDDRVRADTARRLEGHLALVQELHAGTCDLRAAQAAKLRGVLRTAATAKMYASAHPAVSNEDAAAESSIEELLASIPVLAKRDFAVRSRDAFTRAIPKFLHYYESSGTTGAPVAAPKALDDLVVNTANIGEMWRRFLTPDDVALILIIAPLAPAPYQFEKVLEYLGIMSLRPWVDYTDGDYTKVLRLVNDLSVNVFVGAPSRLLAMIQFAARHGLPAPRFDRLLLIAEQTGPQFLRHVERLTGARAYVGCYGSSETGTIAVTCEYGQLHLQLQSYVLELYSTDRGARVVDGSPDRGELVVTTLDLPARPLLRYRTGDLIEVSGVPCPCGLALPVARTQGREQDVLAMPGGAVRQDDFEAALWAEDLSGPTALNYMLVIRGEQIVTLVTTDDTPGPGWASDTAERLAPVFPEHRLSVRPVEVLSPLASLTGDLGWKLSHVVDLDDPAMRRRLPSSIADVVEQALGEFKVVAT